MPGRKYNDGRWSNRTSRKKKRCKNGTRRNAKTGKCEQPKRRLRSNSKRTRRCPNGQRRSPPKTGSCVRRSARKGSTANNMKDFLKGIKSLTPRR